VAVAGPIVGLQILAANLASTHYLRKIVSQSTTATPIATFQISARSLDPTIDSRSFPSFFQSSIVATVPPTVPKIPAINFVAAIAKVIHYLHDSDKPLAQTTSHLKPCYNKLYIFHSFSYTPQKFYYYQTIVHNNKIIYRKTSIILLFQVDI
jgi:hypothetical protein